jgi:glycosyltransferase involved in cell wall biosynthesis
MADMSDRDSLQHGATIIVCCHNSEMRVSATLKHLAGQVTSVPWEIVLVNNGSTDGTVAIAKSAWQESQSPVELRIIDEPRLGLSFARERGILEARYEYIIFCDDDNWLDAQYVQLAVEILDSRQDVGALGGCCKPTSSIEFPAWFWTHARNYAVGAQALESGDITERRLVWGAGMILRASVVRRILAEQVKNLLVDREGGKLTTGGDGEICKWLILAGYRLWYDERLRLTHYIPAERLTKEYFQRLRAGAEDAGQLMKPYQMVIDAEMTKRFLDRVVQLFGGVAKMCLGDNRGRSIVQAYHPLPALVIDRTTRDIQLIAKRLRNAAPPLSSTTATFEGIGNGQITTEQAKLM